MNKKNRRFLSQKSIALFLVFFMILNLGSLVFAGYERAEPSLPENAVPGELIVKRSEGGTSVATSSFIPGVYSKERLFNLDKGPFGLASAYSSIQEESAVRDLAGYYIYRMEEEKTQDVYMRLSLDPSVEEVSYNYIVNTSNYSPNDPLYSTQYNLPKINAGEAINDVSGGESDIVIAVLDSGVRGTHEDLSGKVLAGYDFINNRSISAGTDSDDNGHGTAVASVAAAKCNNNKGISGIACNAKILPVKTLDHAGRGDLIATSRGVIYAVNNGAHVINLSLGANINMTSFSFFSDIFRYAHENNVATISAAGNDGIDMAKNSPANIPYTITVGASDQSDNRASFSNFGSKIDFVAPGVAIPAATDTSDSAYDNFPGTSLSAPQVSGVIALMLSKNRALSVEQIRQILRKTATDIDAQGFDANTGFGLINAGSAVSSSASSLPSVGMIESLPDNISGQVAIKGYAKGVNFSSYQLSYGAGTNPSSYTQIMSDSTPKTSRDSVLGTWNTSTLSSGNYVLRLNVTNNDSSQIFFKMYVNIVSNAPYISVANPIHINSANATLSGSASAASGANISQVGYCLNPDPSCTLNMINIVPANSVSFNINLTGLTENKYYLIVAAYDSFGRDSRQDIHFEVDLTAPDVPIISSPINGSNSPSRNVNFSGTANRDSSVSLFHNEVSVGSAKVGYNGSWSKSVELTPGTNTLKAKAVDPAGNTSLTTQVVVNFSAKYFEVTPSKTALLAGEKFNLTVTARDANGNIDTSYVGEVTFTSTDSRAILSSPYTFSGAENGVRVFSDMVFKTSGTQTISVTAENGFGMTPNVTVSPGPASKIEKISGDSQTAVVNRVLANPLVLKVTDELDNGVPSISITPVVTSGGGSVVNVPIQTNSDGQATIQWKMGSAAGPNTLEVSFGGVCTGTCPTLNFSATATPFVSNVTPENGSGGIPIKSEEGKAGITFPSGSVSEPVFVSIKKVAEGIPASPAGKILVSDYYKIAVEKESGELQTSFASGLPLLSFSFDSSLVSTAKQNTVRINYWNSGLGEWTLDGLTNQNVNFSAGNISANTNHLSGFAVLADSTPGSPQGGVPSGPLPRTGIDFFRVILINFTIAAFLQISLTVFLRRIAIRKKLATI